MFDSTHANSLLAIFLANLRYTLPECYWYLIWNKHLLAAFRSIRYIVNYFGKLYHPSTTNYFFPLFLHPSHLLLSATHLLQFIPSWPSSRFDSDKLWSGHGVFCISVCHFHSNNNNNKKLFHFANRNSSPAPKIHFSCFLSAGGIEVGMICGMWLFRLNRCFTMAHSYNTIVNKYKCIQWLWWFNHSQRQPPPTKQQQQHQPTAREKKLFAFISRWWW